MARLAHVVLEFDFCVLERAGARAALNDTDEMDETGERESTAAESSTLSQFRDGAAA